MTRLDNSAETRIRKMFRDAALQIDPSDPESRTGATMPRVSRGAPLRLTLVLAFCLAIAAAVVIDVHPWGRSGDVGSSGARGGSGALLTVRSDGAVELLAPDTGAVLRTLVGPSAMDSAGRHLGKPYAVTASVDIAYLGYLQPSSAIIESVPLSGGVPKYVTEGMYPAVNTDGTKLAFVKFPGASGDEIRGAVMVRDLATGSEQAVYPTPGVTLVTGLSWSPDGTQLALAGIFMPNATGPPLGDSLIGVQILAVNQPNSDTNPHFIGTPTPISSAKDTPAWTDGQFLPSGHEVAVLSSNLNDSCPTMSTRVLSVDVATGQTATVATVPFNISHAVFDQAGDLVAVQRILCSSSVTGTTTSTNTSTTVPGLNPIGSTGGSHGVGFFVASPTGSVLESWSHGRSSVLASKVVTATFVILA